MGAKMRGSDERHEALFSYVKLEDRVPARHPLRLIREIVNAALARLDGAFAPLYAAEGRPSIAPERLLRAVLIQILFSVRSERQLMEQMRYNLLFRWFVGLGIDDPVWVPTVFSKNRDRLLTTDIARQFLAALLADKAVVPLLSDEHFSVDGTLIQAWASSLHEELSAQSLPRRKGSGGGEWRRPDRRCCRPRSGGRRVDDRTGRQRQCELRFSGWRCVGQRTGSWWRRRTGPRWRCANR